MTPVTSFSGVPLDATVTTGDGRTGVVIGLDPDKRVVAFVEAGDPRVVHRVTAAEIVAVDPFG